MLNQERTGRTLGPHPHPSPPEGQPGPFSKCCPRCPLCPGTQVLVQLSPQFHGCVSGLYGDFDGDASNDLRSRRGVLELTAELATPLLAPQSALPRARRTAAPLHREHWQERGKGGGQLQNPGQGCPAGGVWPARGAVLAGEHPLGWLGSHALRGDAAGALHQVPRRDASIAALRVVCVGQLRVSSRPGD